MIITTAILISVYAYILYRVKTKYMLITKIIVMLLIQNTVSLLCVFVLYQGLMWQESLNGGSTYNGNTGFWTWTEGIFYSIISVLFGVAHWMFVFEYYKISCFMPYVVKDEDIPSDMVTFHKRLNTTMLSLNVIVMLGEGILMILHNRCIYSDCNQNIWNLPLLVFCTIGFVLLIATGVFMFVAVFKIRAFFLEQGTSDDRINVKMMVLHTSSFGLFILSTLGVFVMFWIWCVNEWTFVTADDYYFGAQILFTISAFGSQVILATILL